MRKTACMLIAVTIAFSTICSGSSAEVQTPVRWIETIRNPGSNFSSGLAYVDSGRLIASDGTSISIACPPDIPFEFQNGLCLAIKGERYTYLDSSGRQAFPTDYAMASPFHNGYALVSPDYSETMVIDCTGQTVYTLPEQYTTGKWTRVYGTRFRVYDTETELVGVYDFASRQLVVPCVYDSIILTADGQRMQVSKDGKLGFLDESGRMIIPCTYTSVSYNITGGVDQIWLYDGVHWGSRSILTGEEIHPFDVPYEKLNVFADGLTAIEQDGSFGYMDLDGNMAIPFGQYEFTATFREGLAAVKVVGGDGKFGYIDTTGKIVIPPQFDTAYPFQEGLTWVRKDGIWGIMEHPDAVVSSPWAQDELRMAKNLGLITPRTERWFTRDITRVQFAELVVSLAEHATGTYIDARSTFPFRDTADLSARKASVASLVSGTGDGTTFSPTELLTREQLATMLVRAMRYIEGQTGKTVLQDGDLSQYTDQALVSDWAIDAVSILSATGIMKGTDDTTLSPQDTTTVEQAILLILRAYQAVQR